MRVSILLLLACLVAVAHCQNSDQPISPVTATCATGTAGTISINGNGRQTALADEAEVSLKISTRNRTADEARSAAAVFAEDVINGVRNISGIFPDNVTTSSISITPVSTRADQDGVATIIAYTFSNSISVKISNVSNDLLSEVLDTAVARGGNNMTVSSVNFRLSDSLSYNITVEAREQAARDARATAETYAQALGVNLGPILRITDKTYSATPIQDSTTSRSYESSSSSSSSYASTVATPISVGSQRVTASITMYYTICNPAA